MLTGVKGGSNDYYYYYRPGRADGPTPPTAATATTVTTATIAAVGSGNGNGSAVNGKASAKEDASTEDLFGETPDPHAPVDAPQKD